MSSDRDDIGLEILRMIYMGINDASMFNLSDAREVIDKKVTSLIHLGAVVYTNGLELTEEGIQFLQLGIQPKLGKLILQCFHNGLGKEGLVLAAMAHNITTNIFCRFGNKEEKHKSDCNKLKFCHIDGDLFTRLTVYKEWEAIPSFKRRNEWCWQNSVNAKFMRSCEDFILQMKVSLETKLGFIVPSCWSWNQLVATKSDKYIKKAILSSMVENLSMHSGYDQLGYEVAASLNGKHVQLHPSSSLLLFTQRPSWIVFVDISSSTDQNLVYGATSVDYEDFSIINSHHFLLHDAIRVMQERKLQHTVMNDGYGSNLLKRFCGKSSSNLLHIVSSLRQGFKDQRIGVVVKVDQNLIHIYAPSQNMDPVCDYVKAMLEYEKKWLQNECVAKFLYHEGQPHNLNVTPPFALLGSGAEIKHLELERKTLTVDVFCSADSEFDVENSKKLLMYLDAILSEGICGFQKCYANANDGSSRNSNTGARWDRITFLSSDDAEQVVKLSPIKLNGALFEIVPSSMSSSSTTSTRHNNKEFRFFKVKLNWPRRHSKKSEIHACEVELYREIARRMPQQFNHQDVRVRVYPPSAEDAFIRAEVMFDRSLYLEAVTVLEELEGKYLSCCRRWQKIKFQNLFRSSFSCSIPVYICIRQQLDALLANFRLRRGVTCRLKMNESRTSYRVKISAQDRNTIAELRGPLEQLMRGKNLDHSSITTDVMETINKRDGMVMLESLMKETGCHIKLDKYKYTLCIFGPTPLEVDNAEQKLIQSLLKLYEKKDLEIHLRGNELPHDLTKRVIRKFGSNLEGLKERVPEADFKINIRLHIIYVDGSMEQKEKVENIIKEIAEAGCSSEAETIAGEEDEDTSCPICLCKVELDDDAYRLEDCGHLFCRTCLVEQCESAVRNRGDSFPICCMFPGCRKSKFLLADIRAIVFPREKLDKLFRASVAAHVAASGGKLRFCPSPDCPSIYRVLAEEEEDTNQKYLECHSCGACNRETCRRCHSEYHPFITCQNYREFKEDPDSSLRKWAEGKEDVKNCPLCNYTIEKNEGCNHMECICGVHICWVCLEVFNSSDQCYSHLRSFHFSIN